MQEITRLAIDITRAVTQEQLEYIFDCWVTFVMQDLGWDAKDAIMHETEPPTE